MNSSRLLFAAIALSLLQSGCGSDPAATCANGVGVTDTGIDTGGAGDTGVTGDASDAGAGDTGVDAGDGGMVAATKGRVRFGISVGDVRVTSLTATLDGVDIAAFGGQPMAGTAPAFSAGTADDGLEVEAGIHRFSVTLQAPVVYCSIPVPNCVPVDAHAALTHAADLTVVPGREQTAVVLFRVLNEGFGGSERVVGRITTFDSTSATSGSLAGVARLQLIRAPSVLFDGTDRITVGTDPAVFLVEANDDGVMQIPANTGGALRVSMGQFVGPIVTTGTLPPVPAGRVLPVVLGDNITIPSAHAGTGQNLVP